MSLEDLYERLDGRYETIEEEFVAMCGQYDDGSLRPNVVVEFDTDRITISNDHNVDLDVYVDNDKIIVEGDINQPYEITREFESPDELLYWLDNDIFTSVF